MVHNRHKHLGSQADCCLRQPGLRSSSSPTFLNKLARDKQKSCNQETVLLLWAIPDLFQCFLSQSGQQTISSRTDWSGLVQKTRAIVVIVTMWFTLCMIRAGISDDSRRMLRAKTGRIRALMVMIRASEIFCRCSACRERRNTFGTMCSLLI